MVSVANSKENNVKHYTQWIGTLGVFMVMMQIGLITAWTAPNVPRLSSEEMGFPVTPVQISWIVSMVGLGGIPGAVISSILLSSIGSKRMILTSFAIISLSWICMIFANSYIWIYASRLMSGLMYALVYSSFSLYLSEIAATEIRGTLISLAAIGSPFGTVVGSVMESYLSTKVSSSIYLAESIIGIILFLWLEDTPYYLVKINDLERTRASIAFYNGSSGVDEKFTEIKSFVDADAGDNWTDKFRRFKSPVIRKSMFLIFMLFGFPHFSGYTNVTSYMEVMLKSGRSVPLIDPHQFVIYVNISSIISTVLTMKLIDIMGRRFLLISSSLGTSVALMGIGIYYFLLHSDYDANALKLLPIIFVDVYIVAYSIGYGPVPSTIMSEIFPQNMKNVAAFMATLSAASLTFLTSKIYQPIVDVAGEECAYWINAVCSLLAIPCALYVMPETKGKTFQEIQDMLVDDKKLNVYREFF